MVCLAAAGRLALPSPASTVRPMHLPKNPPTHPLTHPPTAQEAEQRPQPGQGRQGGRPAAAHLRGRHAVVRRRAGHLRHGRRRPVEPGYRYGGGLRRRRRHPLPPGGECFLDLFLLGIWRVQHGGSKSEAANHRTTAASFPQVLSRENNANYNAIDYHALTERVRARHPYWGYLMLQHALEGGADIIGREINGECKVRVVGTLHRELLLRACVPHSLSITTRAPPTPHLTSTQLTSPHTSLPNPSSKKPPRSGCCAPARPARCAPSSSTRSTPPSAPPTSNSTRRR